VLVYRNDALTVAEAAKLQPTHLVISPGPGRPDDAGSSLAMIEAFGSFRARRVWATRASQHFGGEIIGAALMHGKTSLVQHDGATIYRGLSNPFEVGRYHSLAANREKMPADLIVTARTTDGEIMGVRHRHMNVEGVQFHPESVLTPEGPRLLGNFLYP
jgi:anthranilate synthase component 2/para-aminobenzoate synthetase component 2